MEKTNVGKKLRNIKGREIFLKQRAQGRPYQDDICENMEYYKGKNIVDI